MGPPIMESKVQSFIEHLFGECPLISTVHHPLAHGYGAFFSSSFTRAIVFSVDGVGDRESTNVFLADRDQGLQIVHKEPIETSLGIFYSVFTSFLGFKSIEGEYKLMGMASYGEPRFRDVVESIKFCNTNEKIIVNFPDEFLPKKRTAISEPYYRKELAGFLGVDRPNTTYEFTQQHYDLAASVQQAFENAYIGLVEYFTNKFQRQHVCLAGGCALNCLANSKLKQNEVFVMPAASDRGLALGSAFFDAFERGEKPHSVQSMALGISYSKSRILSSLKNSGLQYSVSKNIPSEVATLISKGHVIGWHQGRSEFGPRALGNRSILASCSLKGMKDRLNQKIKFREKYRPFAPAILETEVSRHSPKVFQNSFMTSALLIESEKEQLNEAINIDGTARVQTVKEGDILYPLLVELKRKTGYGGVINTSFNLAGEPIVETPEDAIRTFVSSGLDYLVIGDYVVEKVGPIDG